MPTLQELTLAHSQRLSEVYRFREVRLAEAQASRDLLLRAIPEAAKAFQKYDDELASAREKQLATDAKAEAARTSVLLTAIDRRADALEDAQLTRRSTDVEAVSARRRAEDAAAAKYLAALNAARELNDAQRGRALQDAERTRRLELDQARRAHDDALTASQQRYRASVDAAIIDERRDGRDGERGYFDAIRLGEAAAKAARLAAEQTLYATLAGVAAAADVLKTWRQQVSTIKAETAKAEKDEFSRFRREMETVTSR
jgi:hypothetical protein